MDPLPVPDTYATIESRIADEDEPLPAVQVDCTMTLRVPAIDDPVDLPRLVEDLRAQFERQLRALCNGEIVYVDVGIHGHMDIDTHEMARDAIAAGGQLWHSEGVIGVRLGRGASGRTGIYVTRRRLNGRA